MEAQFIMMLMMRMKTAGDNGADEKEGQWHINDTRRAAHATITTLKMRQRRASFQSCNVRRYQDT